MSDYRTTILFDLRRCLRIMRITDPEGQRALYENIGFWLLQVRDERELSLWMDLFVLDVAALHPGLHEDYCKAAVLRWMEMQKEAA